MLEAPPQDEHESNSASPRAFGLLLGSILAVIGLVPMLANKFGRPLYFLDHRLKDFATNPKRIKAWLMDQYQHPHETRHSMDEVLGWFDRYGVSFFNGIPHIDGSGFSGAEQLLEAKSRGNAISRVATQMEMLLSGGKDGGLFIMIGKKL
jgi:hypothetical protein